MSVVTTVIVVLSWDPEGKTLAAISAFTGTSQDAPLTWGKTPLDPCGEHVGGYKCMECDLFIGAFNHFDWEAFREHLRTVPWEEIALSDSCVIVQSCDLSRLEVFHPRGPRAPYWIDDEDRASDGG